MKLTKIVATLGPMSDSPEVIEGLIRNGVDVFRFNFKHGEVAWHKERVQRVREVAGRLNAQVMCMMDLQGPSFRLVLDAPSIEVKIGDLVDLGSPSFNLTHPQILNGLRPGHKVLFDDGTIEFEVVEPKTAAGTVKIKCLTNALLKTRKSLNVPNVDFEVDLLTKRDLDGIQIAADEKMELAAFSFVRTAQDIIDFRAKLDEYGCHAKIVAKMETTQCIDHPDAIAQKTDWIMVARGDLAVEAGYEKVPYYQRLMIEACQKYGKVSLVATQMLATMEQNKFPTRAEANDVATAVWQGATAVMLSGETANGADAVNVVAMMTKIIEFAESHK